MKGSLRAKIGAFWACFGCSSGMFALVEKLGSLLVCAASRGVTLREAPKNPPGRLGRSNSIRLGVCCVARGSALAPEGFAGIVAGRVAWLTRSHEVCCRPRPDPTNGN